LILFAAPFWALSIGMVLELIHAALRKSEITLSEGTLSIDRWGLFGWKHRQWPIDAVCSVSVDVKRTANDVGPIWSSALKIEAKDGSSARLLGHRDKVELEWVATILRDAMGQRGPT
jgi:hypothetical protein